VPAHLSIAVPPAVADAALGAHARTRREPLHSGPWAPGPSALGSAGVVQAGLLVREVAVGPTSSAELLGPGDVLLVPMADDHLLPECATRWTVLHPGAIAWLNGTMDDLAPRLAMTLLARAQRRIDHLAFCQSVTQLKRIDDRVLAMLWHLAERWGHVTPDCVVIELSLTHRALGRLVGAQRPSVTTALGMLARRGALDRSPDGSWRLLSTPPEWWHTPEPPASPWLRLASHPAEVAG
jgi:CRP/FNR family cyclic AMP-dependent transcriptional regulator